MTSACQLDGDGGGDGGLAHTSLAHGHDHALARTLELIDELLQGRGQLAAVCRRRSRLGSGIVVEHVAQGLHAEQRTRAEPHVLPRKLCETGGHGRERLTTPGLERCRDCVVLAAGMEDAVQDETLVGHPEFAQLSARPLGFRGSGE
jgi:hypothetical protein